MLGPAFVSSVESMVAFYCGSILGLATIAPPPSVIGRSIGLQGVGQFLDGCFGSGVGSASSYPSLGLVGATRIGSRRVPQAAATLMICTSILGKVGMVFAAIPFPVFAALYFYLYYYIGTTADRCKEKIDTKSKRNKKVIQITLIAGVFISHSFMMTEVGYIKTKQIWFNEIVNAVLSSGCTIAIVVAVVLDRVLPDRLESYLAWWGRTLDDSYESFYGYPTAINKYILKRGT